MSAPPNRKGSSSRPTGTVGARRFYLRPRTKIWLLIGCLGPMLAVSIYAVIQPLNPDPADTSRWARFWHPYETNPYARLLAVDCDQDKFKDYACQLNSVAINGTSELPEVWAVGNVGLVLHRSAGQTGWKQLTITAEEEATSAKPSPSPAPSPRPSDQRTQASPAPSTAIQEAVVPDLRGRDLAQATAMAESAGFKIEAAASKSPRPLRVVDQSPAPGTRAPRGSLITVKLSAPAAASGLFDNLLPKVYAAGKESPKQKPQQRQSVAILTVNRTRGPAPLTVMATTTGSWQPAKIVKSTFSWGDGTQFEGTTGSSVSHVYQTPGTFVIKASVTDDRGVVSTAEAVAITVDPPKTSHSSTFPLADDDLIYVACSEKDGCRTLGRSGRVYKVSSSSQWKFIQARFVTPDLFSKDVFRGDEKPIPSSAELNSTIDGVIYAKLTESYYKCEEYKGFSSFSAHPVYRCLAGTNMVNPRAAEPAPTHGLPQNLSTKGTVRAEKFLFTPKLLAFVVGDKGLILSSTNAGITWRHETQGPEGAALNYRFPAPWYWQLAILLIFTCTVVVAIPAVPQPAEVSVADWTVTDAPLKPGDPDSLNFTPMALGLSRFIRNPKTQPPVTIAIEGEWGEGKSSVMSLLKCDLEKSRFRPVWFNAWHHQSEDQLLAALLEHIKDQAIPPSWHIDNWIFRVHLLRSRFQRKWPLLLILALLLCGATAFEITLHGFNDLVSPAELIPFKDSIPILKDLHLWDAKDSDSSTQSGAGLPKAAEPKSPNPDASAQGGAGPSGPSQSKSSANVSHLGLFLSALTFLAWLVKTARAFGIDSAKLTDNLRDASTIKDVKPDPGIRRQFAREFCDFCQAWSWGSRRVILFIDDLDRCRPESVVTVLESINFLTTAGDCVVVLGMAQNQVTHCVGLSFKDIADAEETYRGGCNTEREKAVARFKYGGLYIKKLVNIVAPLPKTTPEQRRGVLEARAAQARQQDEQEKASTASSSRIRLWAALSKSGRLAFKFAPVVAMLLALGLSVYFGYLRGQLEKAEEEKSRTASAATKPSSDQGAAENPNNIASPTPTPAPSVEVAQTFSYKPLTTQPARLIEPPASTDGGIWRSFVVEGFLLAVLFGILKYQLGARTNQDAQNSPEFEQSLKLWGRYILAVCDTPREIKRALNDLRYQAMTRRTNGPSVTRGERLTRTFRKWVTGQAENPPTEVQVDEAALPPFKAAALASLTDEEMKSFLDPDKLDMRGSENLQRLIELKREHMRQFGRWFGEVKTADSTIPLEPENGVARATQQA